VDFRLLEEDAVYGPWLMEAAISETLVTIYQSIRLHIQDENLHHQVCDNLVSHLLDAIMQNVSVVTALLVRRPKTMFGSQQGQTFFSLSYLQK
jgi:hypothetical protein